MLDDEPPTTVECWQCGETLVPILGFARCNSCGCSQNEKPTSSSISPNYDPDFAANMSSPA